MVFGSGRFSDMSLYILRNRLIERDLTGISAISSHQSISHLGRCIVGDKFDGTIDQDKIDTAPMVAAKNAGAIGVPVISVVIESFG